MCDLSKCKSSGFCRSAKKIRSVPCTKWELPIPGSKPYWEEVCKDIEGNVKRVSFPIPYFPANPTDGDICHKSYRDTNKFDRVKCNASREPIVKISPPTPLHTQLRNVDENQITAEIVAGNDNSMINDRDNQLRTLVNSTGTGTPEPTFDVLSVDPKFSKISALVNDFLKNSKVRSRKLDPIHRNESPLQLSVDDLAKISFSEKKSKLDRADIFHAIARDSSELSKLRKLSPLRSRSITGDESRQILEHVDARNSEIAKRPKTPDSQQHTTGHQFLSELSHSQSSLTSFKFKIIEKNLDSVLRVPKLEEFLDNEKLFSAESAILEATTNHEEDHAKTSLQTSVGVQANSEKEISGGVDRRTQPGVELKVPKLGTVSLHPSFNKARSSESLDEIYRSLDESDSCALSESGAADQIFPDINTKQKARSKLTDLEEASFEKSKKLISKDSSFNFVNSHPSFSRLSSVEKFDAKDDQASSKVPKLSTVSGYPSFSSPASNDLDRENDSSTFCSRKATFDRSSRKEEAVPRTEIDSTLRDSKKSKSTNALDERSTSVENRKPSQNHRSLKYSIRYACKALKFLTGNKNLDFTSKTYDPTKKSLSSSRSNSSADVSESALNRQLAVDGSERVSSNIATSYESVRNRLGEKAPPIYVGPTCASSDSKTTSKIEFTTTIPTTTRSTSGPSTKFQAPIFKNPLAEKLERIPRMSIFPRKKRDKCFSCLHKPFEEPVKVKRELPLAVIESAMLERRPSSSGTDTSSVNLTYFDDLLTKHREDEKSASISKGIESSDPDQSLPSKSVANTAKLTLKKQGSRTLSPQNTVNGNLSPEILQLSKVDSKSLSVTSEHTKASSPSGQSSESEENQIEGEDKAQTTSKYFVSCHAPLNWRPSLEPLKALRFKKPVSVHSRSSSIAKPVEGDDDEERSSGDSLSVRRDLTKTVVQEQRGKINSNENAMIKSKLESVESRSGVRRQTTLDIASEERTSIASDTRTDRPAMADRQELAKESIKQKSMEFEGEHSKSSFSPTVKTVKVLAKATSMSKMSSFDEDKSKERVKLMHSQSSANLKLNLSSSLETSLQLQSSSDTEISPKRLEVLSERTIPDSIDDTGDKRENFEASLADPSKSVSREIKGAYSTEKFTVVKRPKPKLPLTSRRELLEILRKCIEENQTPSGMLISLRNEFLNNESISSRNTNNPEVSRSIELVKKLVKLLVESKLYLTPDKFPSDIEFSSKQPPLSNTRQLRRVLPSETYNLVAPILGIPNSYEKRSYPESDIRRNRIWRLPSRSQIRKKSTVGSIDMIVHAPSKNASSAASTDGCPPLNPYALFLAKPRRKAVTWRPLEPKDLLGYDPEATLNMRATRVTNKICKDFCEWLRSLGGSTNGIDEEVLKDMFQIEPTADACRTIQVIVKELPMVPSVVAQTRNSPEAGELALTRKYLSKDARAEKKTKKVRAFGTTLPEGTFYVPPNNRVNEKWLQCENVPKDLETMDAVWKNITRLDSVKGFLNWLREHPNVKPPKALKDALESKETTTGPIQEDQSQFAHLELDLDQIGSLKVIGNDDRENSH